MNAGVFELSPVNASSTQELSGIEGVHSPVKPPLFKVNAGASEGTLTASFMYEPDCTHRLNRR